MSAPRVTVLMSVHNGGRWLRLVIESVLAQTWRDFEFLIIDDASTDDSAAQIAGFRDARIRFIRLPENIGLTRSLNVGLREARGELIARQDADDLSRPERLARQIAFLDTHPDVTVVGSQARLIDADGHSRGTRDLPLQTTGIRWLSLLDNPLIHTAAMFRVSVVRDELGGYDESFGCCQDYDLWARVLVRHLARNLPERLVSVREHGRSISATRRDEARMMVRRVVRRLADIWLPRLALSDDEVALLCAYRRHLTPDEVPPFRRLLERCDVEFVAQFGSADQELARAHAAVFARIGYNLLTSDRSLAWEQLSDAVRVSPRTALNIPWPRVAALSLLGERARGAVERLRGASVDRE